MLNVGTSLGPYRILAPLGAGGMGEVYRAHDPRLGRDVAIKVLAPHLAATPEARARFEREARTISQLNHPHICTLHDIGREGDTDYLVMELLEGETLAHRLEKGPLPVADVLALGAQIADALDRAHRAGVVHRDLKPGNVMLTKSGAKLMDFGLARAAGLIVAGRVTPGDGGVALTVNAAAPGETATASLPLTAEGAIVGTFQYMAPEQLEGKEADARTDIWALGCVLYEMATGKRAFEGTSQASLIAAILEHEPPSMMERQPLTPAALEHLVKRCLEKDAADRWQSARDVTHELKWINDATSLAGSMAAAPLRTAAGHRRSRRLARAGVIAAIALAIVAVSAIAAFLWARRQPAPRLARLTITAPEGEIIYTNSPSAAVSPDGRLVAFAVVDSAGMIRLRIRPLESSTVRPLAVTASSVAYPFWSPDSRSIAFFADGKLKKISASSGAPETICDAPDGRGGCWSKNGVIVFAPQGLGPLQRVQADGGEAVTVARPDSARGEAALRFPCFLPDGRHFLYVALPRRQGQFDVYVGDLDSRETKLVMTAGSAPVYAEPGYLIFARNDRLVAQRFDRSRLRPAGPLVPLDDELPPTDTEGAPLLCSPARGVMVYVAAKTPNTQLTWLDRAGRPAGVVSLPPGRYRYPALSPDSRWAAVVKPSSGGNGDLWLVDLQRAVPTRITTDGMADAGNAPRWSPDGSRIAYGCCSSGPYEIYQVPASGRGRPEPLVQTGTVLKWPLAWSPDGKYFVYGEVGQATAYDLWLLPLDGEGRPRPYLCSPFYEAEADISPDGHWLAYSSDETGDNEIYVQSFPEPGEKHRVSLAGGYRAKWSTDGQELLIWTDSSVYTVEVETAPAFKVGPPGRLFTPTSDVTDITATGDLQRFLGVVPAAPAAPPSITVILNWEAMLRH